MRDKMDIIRASLVIAVLIGGFYLPLADSEKVCYGTTSGLSHQGDAQHRYETLRRLYENCTFVDGNIELVFLNGKDDYDLSFLKDIKVISGYMLIYQVMAKVIPMTNLRIIRGRKRYMPHDERQNEQYSLFVVNNYRNNSNDVGLRQLQFQSLREILSGDVAFQRNNLLCNIDNIYWPDIVIGENAQVLQDLSSKQRTCAPCHPECPEFEGRQHCWGPSKEECQTLTQVTCAKQCESRCYGDLPSQCCHTECAGGCTGPTRKECWACQNFLDEKECVPFCPPVVIYDDKEFKNVPNPNMKFTYGNLCVDQCPSYLVEESGSCVKECAAGKQPVNNTCVSCGEACSSTCTGFKHHDDYLTSANIGRFVNCTKINGNLIILKITLDGERGLPAVRPADLAIFKSVREITGYLTIQCSHPEVRDANFLSNLEIIYGRNLYQQLYALSVVGSSFTSLGLNSLKKIEFGSVLIYNNPDLCYITNTNYSLLLNKPGVQKIHISDNRQMDQCRNNLFVCHEECINGCWGPRSDQCFGCRNFLFNKTCVSMCDRQRGFFLHQNKTCVRCHPECNSTCNGPGSSDCDSCKNVRDGPYCISQCPQTKYPDGQRLCQRCGKYCTGGCTGPNNTIAENGCLTCDLIQVRGDGEGEFEVEQCLDPSEAVCKQPGYYRGLLSRTLNSSIAGKAMCRKCHPLCLTCNGYGVSFCEECAYFRQDHTCVRTCDQDYFLDRPAKRCQKCDAQCRGCYGPTHSDCHQCKSYWLYEDDDTRFNCTEECPAYKAVATRYKVNNTMIYKCVTESEALESSSREKTKVSYVVGGVLGFLAIAIVVLVVVCWRYRISREEKLYKLAQKFTGMDESEPLTPTNASPDMSVLRLAKESELRKGNIIGSGAFGTVFKGMWVPENENVKIPVAIKVLQESTSPSQNKELLEEARVMASVAHPYCVRILAVCMTAQMMLITQLMPLGCLLDYVRKNKPNIGSKVQLNWCTQIAKGMIYLEERGIVHRDLAARNVLVQSPSTVKITDFGLAKLLDYNEEEYRSTGGKMPIKWLALECIQHRIFTHKSDVWSFGVTVWELFTYGQKPYDNIRARDVPDLLEKGERLPQPSICTIDVYMIMIKCWMLDAQSRPTFRELAEEFSKMARDPGRYLLITGDKLMRLPSTQSHKDDFLHSLSIADEGPEQLVDAEDYLQPTSTVPEPKTNGVVDKMQVQNEYDNDRELAAADALEPSCSGSSCPASAKKGAYVGAPLSRKVNGKVPRDSVSSRYSPDPCKVLEDPRGEDSPDLSPSTPGLLNMSDGDEDVFERKPGKVPLPVIDEDDYLQPKSSNPAAYMDLIDGKDYVEPSTQDHMYLEPTSIDNPEYYQQNHLQQQPPDGDLTIDNLKYHKEAPRLRSPSTDSTTSSDADYYNEFDRLNRKKRPAPPVPNHFGETVV